MKNYIIVAVIIVLIIVGVVWYTSKSSTDVSVPATTEGTITTDGGVAPAPIPLDASGNPVGTPVAPETTQLLDASGNPVGTPVPPVSGNTVPVGTPIAPVPTVQ